MLLRAHLALLILSFFVAIPLSAASVPEDGKELSYVVDLGNAASRYVHITMAFEPTGETSELMMAVWTPGSYLVREYARHLDGLKVVDQSGNELPVRKTRKLSLIHI